MTEYKPRGMSIERLMAIPVKERLLPTSVWHSAPCVRVSMLRRKAFASAVLMFRNAGLFVVVIPDVSVSWCGLVRVHRVHISNDAAYLAGFVDNAKES